jgi:hypothetical protein
MVSKVLPDFAATHLPPMSNCLGFLRKPNTALDVTPLAAFSIDGTAAAISNSSDNLGESPVY